MSEQAKTEIVVDPELAANYARIKNVSIEEATEKLRENFAKEANVDIGQRLAALRNGFAKLQPQVAGLAQREGDYIYGIKQLEGKFAGLQKEMDELNARLTFERETYAKSMALLNGIVKHDAETMARIAKLETPSESLFKRIVNKVKCLLKP